MDTWVFTWLFWLGGFFLAYELFAALTGQRTLSEQTWNWFSLGQRKRYWLARRVVFVAFWILLGTHFVFQAPALLSVILPGIPFAAVIVLSSFVWKDATVSGPRALLDQKGNDMKNFFRKVWGALKGGGAWVLRRGPLWSSLLVGAAVVVPGAAPILKAVAAALAGVSGGSVDQQTVQTFGEVVSALLLFVGAVRKFWAIVKPILVTVVPK